jgi:hypothetical protein
VGRDGTAVFGRLGETCVLLVEAKHEHARKLPLELYKSLTWDRGTPPWMHRQPASSANFLPTSPITRREHGWLRTMGRIRICPGGAMSPWADQGHAP